MSVRYDNHKLFEFIVIEWTRVACYILWNANVNVYFFCSIVNSRKYPVWFFHTWWYTGPDPPLLEFMVNMRWHTNTHKWKYESKNSAQNKYIREWWSTIHVSIQSINSARMRVWLDHQTHKHTPLARTISPSPLSVDKRETINESNYAHHNRIMRHNFYSLVLCMVYNSGNDSSCFHTRWNRREKETEGGRERESANRTREKNQQTKEERKTNVPRDSV